MAIEAWKQAYKDFDPMQPAPHQWRVSRPGSPRSRIQRDLDAGVGAIQRLLVGTQGTGKSTELRALVEDQPAATRRAVLVDLRRHFDWSSPSTSASATPGPCWWPARS